VREPRGPIQVRAADSDDLRWVRLLIARALLGAGYDAPGETRDPDLDDDGYYDYPGRGLWVAYDEDQRVVGCVALDRGDGGLAVLRRLAGTGLYALLSTATQHAKRQRYRAIETVVPPAMEDVRVALEASGFAPSAPGSLLYRLEVLPP